MSDSKSKPTYLFKLVHYSTPPPDPLPEVLELSDLDTKSGFMHFSTAPQVGGTLKHFFVNDPCVYLIRVVYEAVEENIRWEDPTGHVCGDRSGEGMFPHLYNARVGKAEIDSVKKLEKTEEGWDDALEKVKDWLVY